MTWLISKFMKYILNAVLHTDTEAVFVLFMFSHSFTLFSGDFGVTLRSF